MITGTKRPAVDPSVWSRSVFWVTAVYAAALLVILGLSLIDPSSAMLPNGRSGVDGFALNASGLQVLVLTVFGTVQGVRAAKPSAKPYRLCAVLTGFLASVCNVLLLLSVSLPFFFLATQLGMSAVESLPVLLFTHALCGIAFASVGFAFAAWFPRGNVNVRATTLSFLWVLVPPAAYYLLLGGYAPSHPLRDVVLYASPGVSVFLFERGPIGAVGVHGMVVLAMAVAMTVLATWRIRRQRQRDALP